MPETRPAVQRAIARCKGDQFVLVFTDAEGALRVGLSTFENAEKNLRDLNATSALARLREPEWARAFTPQPWPDRVVLELTAEGTHLRHFRHAEKPSA